MAMETARYEAIDPLATGSAAVRTAFENQIAYCRDNGAPITALICHALVELLDDTHGGAVMQRIRAWDGPALADALPLRIAGGLHALHLRHMEPPLEPIYAGSQPEDATARVAGTLERHEAFLLPWLDGPPQTNEAGRSWAFAAAMLWLVEQGCPPDFALFELGSSARRSLLRSRRPARWPRRKRRSPGSCSKPIATLTATSGPSAGGPAGRSRPISPPRIRMEAGWSGRGKDGHPSLVITANAGIQSNLGRKRADWAPAFAGVTLLT